MKSKLQQLIEKKNEATSRYEDLNEEQANLFRLAKKDPKFKELHKLLGPEAFKEQERFLNERFELEPQIQRESRIEQDNQNKYAHLASKGMGDEAMQLQQLADLSEEEQRKRDEERRMFHEEAEKYENKFDKIPKSRYYSPKMKMLEDLKNKQIIEKPPISEPMEKKDNLALKSKKFKTLMNLISK